MLTSHNPVSDMRLTGSRRAYSREMSEPGLAVPVRILAHSLAFLRRLPGGRSPFSGFPQARGGSICRVRKPQPRLVLTKEIQT
jgi:hypothetical protein